MEKIPVLRNMICYFKISLFFRFASTEVSPPGRFHENDGPGEKVDMPPEFPHHDRGGTGVPFVRRMCLSFFPVRLPGLVSVGEFRLGGGGRKRLRMTVNVKEIIVWCMGIIPFFGGGVRIGIQPCIGVVDPVPTLIFHNEKLFCRRHFSAPAECPSAWPYCR